MKMQTSDYKEVMNVVPLSQRQGEAMQKNLCQMSERPVMSIHAIMQNCKRNNLNWEEYKSEFTVKAPKLIEWLNPWKCSWG